MKCIVDNFEYSISKIVNIINDKKTSSIYTIEINLTDRVIQSTSQHLWGIWSIDTSSIRMVPAYKLKINDRLIMKQKIKGN